MEPCVIENQETRPATVDKAEFYNAITMWVENRRAEDALTREEIGGLDAFDRMDAQRKGLLIGLAQYYRTHKTADVAPGLMALGYHLSDNHDGACKMSQTRMARFLSRSRQTIKDGLERLNKEGLISFSGQNGRVSLVVPVIPKALACRNHVVWMLDAVESSMGEPVKATWQVEAGKRLAKRSNNTQQIAAPEVISGNTCQVALTGDESEPAKWPLQVYGKRETATCQGHLAGMEEIDDSNLSRPLGTSSLREVIYKIPPIVPHSGNAAPADEGSSLEADKPCEQAKTSNGRDASPEVSHDHGQPPAFALAPDPGKPARKKRAAKGDNSYTEEFESFFASYRAQAKERTGGKLQAFSAWKKLSAADREKAAKALPYYFAQCKKINRYEQQASTYLSVRGRTFDNYEEDISASQKVDTDRQLKAIFLDLNNKESKWTRQWWSSLASIPKELCDLAMATHGADCLNFHAPAARQC
jgi:hypothetical protein